MTHNDVSHFGETVIIVEQSVMYWQGIVNSLRAKLF